MVTSRIEIPAESRTSDFTITRSVGPLGSVPPTAAAGAFSAEGWNPAGLRIPTGNSSDKILSVATTAVGTLLPDLVPRSRPTVVGPGRGCPALPAGSSALTEPVYAGVGRPTLATWSRLRAHASIEHEVLRPAQQGLQKRLRDPHPDCEAAAFALGVGQRLA